MYVTFRVCMHLTFRVCMHVTSELCMHVIFGNTKLRRSAFLCLHLLVSCNPEFICLWLFGEYYSFHLVPLAYWFILLFCNLHVTVCSFKY